MEYAVEGSRLEKSFVKKRPIGELLRHPFRRAKRIHAVRGVDLRVRRGEIRRVMVLAKASLFLSRLTELYDGVSFVLEANPARVQEQK